MKLINADELRDFLELAIKFFEKLSLRLKTEELEDESIRNVDLSGSILAYKSILKLLEDWPEIKIEIDRNNENDTKRSNRNYRKREKMCSYKLR